MALVHMVNLDVGVAEGSQYLNTTNSQNNFLAESVVGIATIQRVSQTLIPETITRYRRVEEVDRNPVTPYPNNEVAPRLNRHRPPFDLHRCQDRHHLEVA